MLDTDPTDPTPTGNDAEAPTPPAPRKRAPRKAAAAPANDAADTAERPAPRKRAARKATTADDTGAADDGAPPPRTSTRRATKAAAPAPETPIEGAPATGEAEPAPPVKAVRKRTSKKAAAPTDIATAVPADIATAVPAAVEQPGAAPAPLAAPGVLFRAPTAEDSPKRRRPAKKAPSAAFAAPDPAAQPAEPVALPPGATSDVPSDASRTEQATDVDAIDGADSDIDGSDIDGSDIDGSDSLSVDDVVADPDDVRDAAIEQASGARRRRRRGRRGRGGRPADSDSDDTDADSTDSDGGEADNGEPTGDDSAEGADDATADGATPGSTTRRRRRRRSATGDTDATADDPPNTVVHVREPKRGQDAGAGSADDGVRGVKGSTRLEAKRQRRRDGRDTTRRRAPILSEAEFLARREAVDRVMAVRQSGERTQIAVLEDGILVEHYVTRASATSYVGNVYLGRVQNVLPSMEAAFVDIGKGRNGVLYAGEVNWDAAGLGGKSRAIEHALKSGDPVLVQVTKDPIGHKGARLTSQISLPGRFLVYVPGGGMTGISRRLPDTERHRLKSILKKIVPEDGGVIVRTAAEGASEEDLTSDVERLTAQWQEIEQAAANTSAAPTLLHGEPDLAIRVVRDVFNEDFRSLVVQGDGAWQTVSGYLSGVASDLADRARRHTGETDLFRDLRVDEQLMKALDRKVYLPSGGSLVIDRTEAMTVVDVNTGKFIGSGGNLEQTVTRNNLEAAEEIVRQLRLRDVGGIVVIDFIDMVLESNRELVLRRLTECLGRDRTKHQVAEVTSLGLVQMTRKRVGEGLLEAFSEPCTVCHGRGVLVHTEPVDLPAGGGGGDDSTGRSSRRKRGGRGNGADEPVEVAPPASDEQRKAAADAIAAIHRATNGEVSDDTDGAGEPGQHDPVADAARDEVTDEIADLAPDAAPDEAADAARYEAAHAAPDEASDAAPDEAADEASDAAPDEAAGMLAEAMHSVAVTEHESAPAPAAAPSPIAAPARRRRRGASRPAGPPSVA